MIMIYKQKKIKIKPRLKLNHSTYKVIWVRPHPRDDRPFSNTTGILQKKKKTM